MPMIYTDCTVLKVDASGREVMSSYINTDAGEFRRVDSMAPPAPDVPNEPPHVTSVTPSTMPNLDPTPVTLAGTGLAGGVVTGVWFNGYIGNVSYHATSDTAATLTVPSYATLAAHGAAGNVDLALSNADGSVKSNTFRVYFMLD